jgi:hypothetical protein
MSAPHARKPMSRRKRIAFWFLLLALTYGVLEAGVFLVYRPRIESIPLAAAESDSSLSPDVRPGREQAGLGFKDPVMVLHPYLGYVFLPKEEWVDKKPTALAISEDGFLDPKPAVRKRSDGSFLVGVMGGSVAGQLGSWHAARIAEAFDRVLDLDRPAEFVWLGMPGYHQPQQLLQLGYILAQGGEFDLLINLDGFNELAVPGALNAPQGAGPLFPMNWSMVALDVPDPEIRRNLGAVAYLKEIRGARTEAFRTSLWSRSPIARLVHRYRDDDLARRISHHAWQLQEFPTDEIPWFVRGPERNRSPEEGLISASVEMWKQSSLQMQALCDANGIRYLHCLQPNQYDPGSKPLSVTERREAFEEESPYRPLIEEGYPMLRAAGEELRARGVAFHDMSLLFAGMGKTLYVDNCCHFNGDGNEILAEALAEAVRASFGGNASGTPR